ncbi:hypothetical protein EA716_08270 [Acinetobacter baumannii]|uniref:hypothetical protein n=1 Tax=Acinetobacter baumannii TaxID=470 RepID=UPI000F73E3DA|nr:hypothetical protein [Acinetobacter baumannii]RSP95285.1 hypothetical protein EA716_08270 [Acinetobacter baumannii]
MFKFFIISILAWANAANAEFNIENNQDQPVNVKLGYRSVLNSSFIYTDVSKNVDLKKNIITVPYGEVTVLLNPVLNNNNEIKGKNYYFISYQPTILLGESQYKLPFIISDVGAIGTSIIYNDNNISIFSIESYTNPVSNNNSKKFKSDIYVFNKKSIGIYNPSFLSINVKLRSLNDASMKFTKLSSIKYNKKDKSYQIVYDFQKLTEDFASTGKVNYEKFPIQYSFSLIPDKNKPFLIKDIVEKRKGEKNIVSKIENNDMYLYFLK